MIYNYSAHEQIKPVKVASKYVGGSGLELWNSIGKRWCALKETVIVLLIHLLHAPKYPRMEERQKSILWTYVLV